MQKKYEKALKLGVILLGRTFISKNPERTLTFFKKESNIGFVYDALSVNEFHQSEFLSFSIYPESDLINKSLYLLLIDDIKYRIKKLSETDSLNSKFTLVLEELDSKNEIIFNEV